MHVYFVVSLDLTFSSLNFITRMSSVGTGRKIFCEKNDTFDCRRGQRFFSSILYSDRLWGLPRLL